MTKKDQVKKHLESGFSITGIYAWKKFGLYRLSRIIELLRKDGLPIKTTIIRSGDSSYAKYYL
jgi:hypothetical protein